MPLEQMRSVKKLCLIARKKILELNMKSDFPTHQKKLNRKIKISAGIYIISECKSSSEWFIFLFSLVFIFKRFQKLCAHMAGRGPHMFRTFFYPMKKSAG